MVKGRCKYEGCDFIKGRRRGVEPSDFDREHFPQEVSELFDHWEEYPNHAPKKKS